MAMEIDGDEPVVQGLQGAHVIGVQWESFSFLPGFAIGVAAGTLAGQYLGAGNVKQARKAVIACIFLAMLFMGSLGLIMMFAGHSLTSVISTEPIHLELVPKLLFIAGVTQIGFAVMMVIRQALKGVGDTVWTLIITSTSSWGIRLPAAWFLGCLPRNGFSWHLVGSLRRNTCSWSTVFLAISIWKVDETNLNL